MASFAEIAAAAKARREAAENEKSTGVADGTAVESPAVQAAPTPTPAAPQQRKNPFGIRKDSGSESQPGRAEPESGNTASGGSDSGGVQPRPKLASVRIESGPQHADSDASVVAAPSITSLDDLDSSEEPGIADRPSLSHYADETPATAPTRELPADLSKEQFGFVELIDGIYSVLHEPDMLGQQIRSILIELKSNPEYMKLVADEDIRVWVRGMRESMGLAKIKKTETKAKRSTSKSKAKDSDMLAALDDLKDLGIAIPE